MPREAALFDQAGGSIIEGYFLLKEHGGNIPPMWIERAKASRKNLDREVARILKERDLDGLATLRDYELRYRKECFYRGIRTLLDLERSGRTKY